MSKYVPCTCGTRENWVVTMWRHNRSAFNGYHYTDSDYSQVHCTKYLGVWRTKAKYVETLPKGKIGDGRVTDNG